MKKKLLALVLTFMMGISAVIVPTVSAATTNSKSLDKMKEIITSVASQPKTAVSVAPVTGKVAVFQVGIPETFLNGKKTFIDTKNKKVVPIKKGGKTMVPLRFCASSMGGTTTYISDKDYITVKANGKVAMLKIGSKELKITDNSGKILKKITLEVAAVKVNGRVLVPTRAISEGLGSKVFYQKIGKDEFVVVSEKTLTDEQKSYQIALLQNLKTYTFTDSTKTYKVKLSGVWTSEDEGGAAFFENGFYPESVLLSGVTDASVANEYLNMSKSDFEKMYGESISGFAKLTINGKKAVTFNLIIQDEDEDSGEEFTMIMSYCIIASKKAGLMIMGASTDKGFSTEFKKFYTNVTMLK